MLLLVLVLIEPMVSVVLVVCWGPGDSTDASFQIYMRMIEHPHPIDIVATSQS